MSFNRQSYPAVRTRASALCLLSAVAFWAINEVRASDWPSRNGPTADSVVPEADGQGVPVSWDVDTGQNILWSAAIDGLGHSTPVIRGDLLWLTTAAADGTEQFIECRTTDTGAIIYRHLLFRNDDPEPLMNETNTYASPSCVLDDEAVYVHFGTYGTARLKQDTGEVVWQRRDINCRHFRGPGSSPVLHGDLLILTFDGIDRQFLTALNRHTGETVWTTDRSTDYGDLDENGQPKREGDLRKAYSTPGLVRVGEVTQLVSAGSRAAFGYNADTGEELWTIRHDDFNAAAPPCFFDGTAIINTGSSGANLVAVRLNKDTRGDVSESHVIWDRPRGNSRLAAPVLYKGRVYMVTHSGVGVCVDARSGEEVWETRVGGTHIASPIAVNGNIWFFSDDGEVNIFAAGDEPVRVAKNRLPEGVRASPSASDGKVFIRTLTRLYCIGSRPVPPQ